MLWPFSIWLKVACGAFSGHHFVARRLGAPGKKRGFFRLRSSIPHRRARVLQPLLPNQCAQSVRHGFAVGNQHGTRPPFLAVEAQQLSEDDKYAEQHYSAQEAEDESKEAVRAAEEHSRTK